MYSSPIKGKIKLKNGELQHHFQKVDEVQEYPYNDDNDEWGEKRDDDDIEEDKISAEVNITNIEGGIIEDESKNITQKLNNIKNKKIT